MAGDKMKKKMPLTKREKETYRNDWARKNLDRINLTVEKGKKDRIKVCAEKHGESLNAYITRAIDALMMEEERTDA